MYIFIIEIKKNPDFGDNTGDRHRPDDLHYIMSISTKFHPLQMSTYPYIYIFVCRKKWDLNNNPTELYDSSISGSITVIILSEKNI